MKMNIPTPTVEASGDFAEKSFGIGDAGIIFDILRNKLYSNPIAAVCREIASNARDAMREAKKSKEPIHIQLPNNLEPTFKVKDFGIGISPERVENIFIKYAASTKREDNEQTGFFGIGSKSPFSVSDAFSVITNYNGIQYHYSCIIDETRVGKLITLSEKPTKEPNGTTIVIPVKPADFNNFAHYTEISCRHWDPLPVITGSSKFSWQSTEKVLDGSNWFLATSTYGSTDQVKLIIDGIEYPLDLTALRTYADTSLIDAAHGTFYLRFNNGNLTLSANREQVQLDKPTQEKIKDRLEEIKKEIKGLITAKIEAMPNLWEANLYLRTGLMQSFYDTKFLGTLTWKGAELSGYDRGTGCKVFFFSKGSRYDADKIVRREGRYLRFEKNVALYLNDLQLKEPNTKHVEKAFIDDPSLKTLQLICPTDTETVETLNKSISLDKLEPKLLSSITNGTTRKASNHSGTRLVVFKFNGVHYPEKSFGQVRYDAIENDPKRKVLCLLKKETDWRSTVVGRSVVIATGKSPNDYDMDRLRKTFPDVSFYGIDEKTPQDRIDEDFSDLIPLEKFIKDEIIDNKSINYLEIKSADRISARPNKLYDYFDSLKKKITDTDSIFLKHFHLREKLNLLGANHIGMFELYETFHKKITDVEIDAFIKKNPDHDIDASEEEYEKAYPLLKYIQTYYSTDQKFRDMLCHYINLVDKELTQQKKAA